MLEATTYDIIINDIVKNESQISETENYNKDLAEKIMFVLQKLIIEKGVPDFNIVTNNDVNFSFYAQRKFKNYFENQFDVKKKFELNYFFDKDGNCFSLINFNKIEKNDQDFEFCFALALRTFATRLNEIENFLDYQLKEQFNAEIQQFIKFLKLCLRQHEAIISTNVSITVQEWIEANEKTVVKTKNNFAQKSPNEIEAFSLKNVENTNAYFESKIVEITDITYELKKKFIANSTSINDIKALFSGKPILPKNRINWIASFYDLNQFISILKNESNKIEPPKNGIWETTCACFLKDGKEIFPAQISKAKGSKKNNERLKSIIEKL